MEMNMRDSSSDARPQSRVPFAIGDVTRSLVFRKLARILSAMLLVVALIQVGCVYALVGRRPLVVYAPDAELLSPVLINEEVRDGD